MAEQVVLEFLMEHKGEWFSYQELADLLNNRDGTNFNTRAICIACGKLRRSHEINWCNGPDNRIRVAWAVSGRGKHEKTVT
jgi:DNA-binding response OmpR family regulator